MFCALLSVQAIVSILGIVCGMGFTGHDNSLNQFLKASMHGYALRQQAHPHNDNTYVYVAGLHLSVIYTVAHP